MAKAQINYEDDFTVEDETLLSRLEERDRASEVSSGDLYKTGAYVGMMLPSAGIADYFGQYPNPEKAGTLLPSFDENVNKGEYFNAAMQFLGAAGDASYTIPTIGTVTGTGLKALALGGKLSKVQLSKLMDGIGAYMTKTNDPMLAVSGGPNLNMGPSITKMEGPPSGGSNVSDKIDLGSGSLFAPEEKAGRRLLVLSCSDTKCPDVGDKEAIDRYLGPVFQSLKSMGTPIDVDVAIMSAKHGLIRADTPIQNYNDKMSPKKADMFKQDAGQMDRIKNTLDGYDNVIVQGGKDYKDVIRAAAGDAKITEVPGGRGIGDQRKSMKEAIAFGKIDTPVYHYSKNTDPGFTKFSESNRSWFDLGPHVGSTPRSSQDRFIDEVFGVGTRKQIRDTMAKTGQSREEVLKTLKLPPVDGNVGYDAVTNRPIPRNTLGGSIRLKADLSKPFDNPRTGKPFTEASLNDYQAEQYSIHKGERYTADDILSEDPRVDIQDVKKFLRAHSKSLAAEGYTHIPYENAVEGVGDLSYVMLVDRPKGSTKVLQSPVAKKDPKKFDDSDFMMEDGGVVSLKDKAVNMNRGPQGIEPYVQYMKNGGEPKYEQGQDLGDVEMRADLEPYLYGNPLARLGYELYKEGKIDIQGVVSESGGGSQRSYGLFSKDRGEIGYIADQREDSPDPLRILTHELAHAAMDFIEGKDQAGREGFNKYGNVDYEESMVRGGDVLIDQRSPSGEKLAQNYFGRLKPTTQDMRKFMNVSKVAQEALDKKGLPPEVIAEGDTGFSGTSGNRLLSNTDKLKRFFIGKFMNPERNVNNYLNLTGEDIRKAEGGVIGLKDRAVKMYRNVV